MNKQSYRMKLYHMNSLMKYYTYLPAFVHICRTTLFAWTPFASIFSDNHANRCYLNQQINQYLFWWKLKTFPILPCMSLVYPQSHAKGLKSLDQWQMGLVSRMRRCLLGIKSPGTQTNNVLIFPRLSFVIVQRWPYTKSMYKHKSFKDVNTK